MRGVVSEAPGGWSRNIVTKPGFIDLFEAPSRNIARTEGVTTVTFHSALEEDIEFDGEGGQG